MPPLYKLSELGGKTFSSATSVLLPRIYICGVIGLRTCRFCIIGYQ